DILQYYLRCSSGQVNPFQQVQDLPGSVLVVAKGPGPQARLADVSLRVVAEAVGESQGVGGDAGRRGGLLRSAARDHANTKANLEQIQSVLNATEVGLHQLTALVDCRSLHMDYVQALTGLCYDGVEGLIYLVLFSFVTALMFSSIVCSVPHTWPGKR
ncbi:unnamed protein product, partial [Tetraodon nigroviridis]